MWKKGAVAPRVFRSLHVLSWNLSFFPPPSPFPARPSYFCLTLFSWLSYYLRIWNSLLNKKWKLLGSIFLWYCLSCYTMWFSLESVGEVIWQVWLKSVIVREHPYTIPDGGGWYCHIGVEQVCAAVKGMVFRQCTLGKGTVKIREFGYHLPGNWSIGLRF